MRFLLILLFCLKAFSDPLVVGMELTYPPFEMIGTNGKPSGISADMAQALADYLNRPLRIENIPFVGLMPSLQTGKVNCVISSLTVTPERREIVAFSDPYFRTGLCLLISAQSDMTDIQSGDKKGRIIVVKRGTTGQRYAEKNLLQAEVRILDKESACVLELIQGKADAFIYDQLSVYANWQNNLTTTKVNLSSFKEEYWAIGVSKTDPDLLKQINAFLKDFKKKGGFEKLEDKYLKTEKEAFKKLGISLFF